jgi:hypothetical protein
MNNELIKQKIVDTNDNFWLDEPGILFNSNRIDEFFPRNDMSEVEQLNATVRLSIYISLVLAIYKKNINYLYIAIIALLFTYVLYKNSLNKKEHFKNLEKIHDMEKEPTIIYPTQNNPFMNVLPMDYLENPNREAATKLNTYNNEGLVKDINDKFYYNLYRDLDDVYEKNNSQRQYYTMPSTTIPNEQGKFANWLYKTPPTCKEGNGNSCVSNNYNPLKDSKYRNPYFF